MHLRNLRNVINFAIDEGVAQNYAFRNFHIPSEETAMRVLPVEKMRQLAGLKLCKADEEYRDIFLLCFYLIGINMKDLALLTPASYSGGRIEYRRAKTGKLYSIKVEDEARAIIEKYKGAKHLLAPFDRYKRHNDYLVHFNKALRRIGPKNWISRANRCTLTTICPSWNRWNRA